MIDPLLSLAFAMQTNKGAYALLLGSGVSRAAQIPTGWEIVLDLVEKLAQMQDESCGSDPAQWYHDKYGEAPDYSKLLDDIAKSPEERQQLLSAYFEPTEDEREEGLKLPTAAHRAIASLVSGGYVRVIVTTNFDRLIERAIEDEGITPTVLSTPDAIEGALPLVHQKCVVIKVHGDYLDTRIKNTPAELAEYDERVNDLLDRIVDEFGFVICGWSAQWDPALCAVFDRCKSRRFTTYWASREKHADRAERLLQSRSGTTVSISDADAFFTELSEKVASLEQLQQPHPLSVAAAAATVKRLLADDKKLIRLSDLVREETEQAFTSLQTTFAMLQATGNSKDKFKNALTEFQSILEVLRAIGMHGAFWGQPKHERIFPQIVQRLACDPKAGIGGTNLNADLRVIPSVMMLYTMGLAACANDNLEMLVAILRSPEFNDGNKRKPYLISFYWSDVQRWFKLLPEYENNYFPANEWLFGNCREFLRPLIPDDQEYIHLFDRFEIIRSLVYIDLKYNGQLSEQSQSADGPEGRFVCRMRYDESNLLEELKSDDQLVSRLAETGLFCGKPSNLRLAIDKFKVRVAQMGERCR